jgi:hypothetical protein
MAENDKNEPQDNAAPKMKFEVWYAYREKLIPKHHYKEILKADFKAQGTADPATIAEFDKALKRYGVTLG